jgi:hypothetical protein
MRQMNDLSRPAADRQAWWHLFVLLPRLIFGRCDENVTARQHLDLMASSKIEELYKLVATPKIGRGDPPTPAQIAEEKARLGSLSAAYRALTSNMSRKDIDGEVADQIRQLVITSTPPPEELQVTEPPMDEPVPLRGSSDDTGIQLSEKDVEDITGGQQALHRALHHMNGATAPGITGLRVNQLKQLARVHPDVLPELYNAMKAMLLGQAPAHILPYLTGGSVTALRKPNGKIRPIVPQDLLIRLLEKSVAMTQRARFARMLAPHQTAVGVASSIELISKSITATLHKHKGEWGVLKLDITNGFGSVSRRFRSVPTYFPCSISPTHMRMPSG